jgi:hypothetical protein
MSVNFGYGSYGMGSGINTMANSSMGINQGGGIYQSVASQYNCPACYQNGPIPYNYKSNVNPLPQYSFHQSWFSRMLKHFIGG